MVQNKSMKKTVIGPIPHDWLVKKLGDSAYIKARIGWRGLSAKEYTEDGPYLIAGTHIKGSRILWEICDHISMERYDESSEIQLQVGDVILTKDGTIGRVGYIDELPGLATINGTMMLVRPDESFHSKFLYYYFQGPYFQSLIKEKVSGSSVPHIFQRDMVNLSVPVPSIHEQRKIANILTSVDNAISKIEAIIEQTEKVKKGLMQQLLTKGIGHTKFKQTEIGEIPDEWHVMKIDDVAQVVRGASPRPKGDPRYYGGDVPRLMVADVTRDYKYVTPTTDFLTAEGAKLSRPMPAGSLVVVCSGTVGVPAILAVDACIHDGFLALKDIDSDCDLEFLFYFFTLMQKKFDSSATHGGVFTNLTTQIMKDFLIPVPPINEQRTIVSILCQVDSKLTLEQRKLKQINNLKSGLMQVLLTGKVRVKVDDQEVVTT